MRGVHLLFIEPLTVCVIVDSVHQHLYKNRNKKDRNKKYSFGLKCLSFDYIFLKMLIYREMRIIVIFDVIEINIKID